MQGKGCYVLPRNRELARENAMHKMESSLAAAIANVKANGIDKKEIIDKNDLLWEVE